MATAALIQARYRALSHRWSAALAVILAVGGSPAWGQRAEAPATDRITFVRLTNNANALIEEPAAADAAHGRVVFLTVHPEHANLFGSFIARELGRRGYRTMMMNYYGAEQTYEEFLAPIAAAIRQLRSLPGAEKVVLIGGSTGGAELTFYQNVAENGPKACQAPDVVYPCRGKDLSNLPKADGVVLIDINVGAPARTVAIDPAVDNAHPRQRNQALDMFSARNGFDPQTGAASYSTEFRQRYFAAQGTRANHLIDEALARLAKIENGEGDYKDDEPFVVPGSSRELNGARLDLADRRLLSRTHAPHLILKADGSTATQTVVSVFPPAKADVDTIDRLALTTQDVTVRHYLSFYALRTTPDYALTEDDIKGIVWRSTANSAPGSVEGVTVPTLVMAGSCYGHLVFNEIVYDHSVAKDKSYVAVEGGNHTLQACDPKYGDVSKRAWDYVDGWLSKPGRF
jgi:pimeloyl-ACP methyl ester carboxylesterase